MKIWSHRMAQAEEISPDEQEALSTRYGNQILLIRPLLSGRFAIFGNDRQLVEILEEGDMKPERLREMALEAGQRLAPRPSGAIRSEKTVEDIGI